MLLSVELNSDFYCVLSKGLDGLRRQKLGLNDRYVDSNVGITDRYEWLLLADFSRIGHPNPSRI